jgi:hypothetical protein
MAPDDDFTAPDTGSESEAVNVPYEPPPEPAQPIVRAPDGTERPYPGEAERPEELHAPENEIPEAPDSDVPEAL